MFVDRLIAAIREKENPSVVGLDPKLDFVPPELLQRAREAYGNTLEAAAFALTEFNKGIIDAVCDTVPAVKPQCAYYEAYGPAGMQALAETVRYAREKGLLVILDGKRGDIGPTMEAYTAAHLGESPLFSGSVPVFDADALTVNAYMGFDAVESALNACLRFDKGIFVLVRTSNPSSADLQDLTVGDRKVYEIMGDFCEEWGKNHRGEHGYSPVGAVVGATWPRQLSELRARLPHTFFLIPGYGAQGAGVADLAGAFDAAGNGGIVNSSRAVLCARKKYGGDYRSAARAEVLRMKAELRPLLK